MLWRRIRAWSDEIGHDLVANKLLGMSIVPRPVRWRGLRALGMSVDACAIGPGTYFGTRRIAIGCRCQISREVFFDGAATITVHDRVSIGPRSMVITGAHQLGGPLDRVGPLAARPVVIGPGAWLGAGVLVLPGVTVGAGCVVGAGAVVVRDCAPHGLYTGVPAVRVRELERA